jgi:hypothetical protein
MPDLSSDLTMCKIFLLRAQLNHRPARVAKIPAQLFYFQFIASILKHFTSIDNGRLLALPSTSVSRVSSHQDWPEDA